MASIGPLTDAEKRARSEATLARLPQTARVRACWVACDGLRIGRSSDMITMLDDLRLPSRA